VRPEFGNFVLATAAFVIVAMWIFPEAGGKNKCRKKTAGENSAIPAQKARHYCCSAECPLLTQSGHRQQCFMSQIECHMAVVAFPPERTQGECHDLETRSELLSVAAHGHEGAG
jgi:hypothetical protein